MKRKRAPDRWKKSRDLEETYMYRRCERKIENEAWKKKRYKEKQGEEQQVSGKKKGKLAKSKLSNSEGFLILVFACVYRTLSTAYVCLSVSQIVCISAYLQYPSIHPSISLSFYLPVNLYICIFVAANLPACLTACLHLSACLPPCLCLSICLSVSLPPCLPASVCLPASLPPCLCLSVHSSL